MQTLRSFSKEETQESTVNNVAKAELWTTCKAYYLKLWCRGNPPEMYKGLEWILPTKSCRTLEAEIITFLCFGLSASEYVANV